MIRALSGRVLCAIWASSVFATAMAVEASPITLTFEEGSPGASGIASYFDASLSVTFDGGVYVDPGFVGTPGTLWIAQPGFDASGPGYRPIRVSLNSPIDEVRVDVFPPSFADLRATISAFDIAGTLIDSRTSAPFLKECGPLESCPDERNIQRLVITGQGIRSLVLSGAVSSGLNGQTPLFDNLTFFARPIPEPSSGILTGIALALVALAHRKKSGTSRKR